jgi:hypothetical protein
MTGAVRWITIGARLPSAADTQCRSWLAFIPRASATTEIDTPSCWQAPTASALKLAVVPSSRWTGGNHSVSRDVYTSALSEDASLQRHAKKVCSAFISVGTTGHVQTESAVKMLRNMQFCARASTFPAKQI